MEIRSEHPPSTRCGVNFAFFERPSPPCTERQSPRTPGIGSRPNKNEDRFGTIENLNRNHLSDLPGTNSYDKPRARPRRILSRCSVKNSKPLSKRQHCCLLITFAICRTLAVVLPTCVFALLIIGLQSAAKSVAAISALVAICHGLLAQSPVRAMHVEPPRKLEDMAVDLFEFTDMACDYSFGDCWRLIEQASSEERMALNLLIKLARLERQNRTADGTHRMHARHEHFASKPSSSFGSSGLGAVKRSTSTLGTVPSPPPAGQAEWSSAGRAKRSTSTLGTAPVGTKLSLDRSKSGFDSGSGVSRRHVKKKSGSPYATHKKPISGMGRSHSSLSSSGAGKPPTPGSPHVGVSRSYSSLETMSATSFTDFNKRNLQFRIGPGAAEADSSPLLLSVDDTDKPHRNDSNAAVANDSLFLDWVPQNRRPMPAVTEENSDPSMSADNIVEDPGEFVSNRSSYSTLSQKTLFVELDIPINFADSCSDVGGGASSIGRPLADSMVASPSAEKNLRSLPSFGDMRPVVDFQSEGKMTYVSTSDAVLGEGNNPDEIVNANVLMLGQGDEGRPRVRIEFQSQCLRTQNEWQRQLLEQQASLLDAMSTELEVARKRIASSDDVTMVQKELLRQFRKVVTREVASQSTQSGSPDLSQHGVQVFIVEEDPEIRSELEELCKLCEYSYQAFGALDSAMIDIKQWNQRTVSKNSSLTKRKAAQSPRPAESLQPSTCKMVPLVLFGASMLQQIRPGWNNDELFVALTSQVEEFEDVGRQLLASGEAEVREVLHTKGISEYLMHPLSMNSLRGVANEVLRRHFGDEYLLVQTIGRGACGVVYQAKRLRDGEVFALKEISLRKLLPTGKTEVETEVALLQELRWPSLVYLVDAFFDTRKNLQYLLMPILEGGSLGQFRPAGDLEECRVSARHAIDWYAQTIHGVSYLHWHGVLHRDLKPTNLLLGAGQRVLQICDMGSAARLPGPGPHPDCRSSVRMGITTFTYSSPETLIHKIHYAGSDLWSTAVSFFEVFTSRLPHERSELDAWLGQALSPRTLSSEGCDVAGPLRTALHQSDIATDACLIDEIVTELEELMLANPFDRPMASALMVRPGTERRLWNVLRETKAFEDAEVEAEHLKYLSEIRTDAEAANMARASKGGSAEQRIREDAPEHLESASTMASSGMREDTIATSASSGLRSASSGLRSI